MEHRVRGVAAEGLVETEVRGEVAGLAFASVLEPAAVQSVRTRRDTLDVVDRHEVLEQGPTVVGGDVAGHDTGRRCRAPR